MSHLDRNGTPISLGSTVKLVVPGTADECVGTVVDMDFNSVLVEVDYQGAKQSVGVVARDVVDVPALQAALARAEIALKRSAASLDQARVVALRAEETAKDVKLASDSAAAAAKQAAKALKDAESAHKGAIAEHASATKTTQEAIGVSESGEPSVASTQLQVKTSDIITGTSTVLVPVSHGLPDEAKPDAGDGDPSIGMPPPNA